MRIILASQSPRRKELLRRVTPSFTVCVSDADESLPRGIAPTVAVRLLAEKKARAVAALREYEDCCVIGADTVVELDGQILGKPRDAADAHWMLSALSGRAHLVHTGLAVLSPDLEQTDVVTTQVEFYPLTSEEIDRYIATGEPFDKAGAYGIQEEGALFVQSIHGDYYNVMGLPIARLYRILGEILP